MPYQKPTVANVALTAANTEYSYAIPADTRKIFMKSRLNGTLKFAFVSGESGSNYLSLMPTQPWNVDGLQLRGETLYVQSDTNADVLEIITFQYR